MKAQRTVLATITALALASVAMQAQWVSRKTPGFRACPTASRISRRRRRQSWRMATRICRASGTSGDMTYFHDLARGLKGDDAPKLTPWAAGLQKGRRDRNHVDDPYTYCLPLGVPRQNHRSPFKIVQTPPMTIFLHESYRRQHVPADLHRWPAAAEAERDRAGLAGILGRPLGGRHVRRREHRIPRQRLAQREHGVPEQRRPEGDRALPARSTSVTWKRPSPSTIPRRT